MVSSLDSMDAYFGIPFPVAYLPQLVVGYRPLRQNEGHSWELSLLVDPGRTPVARDI